MPQSLSMLYVHLIFSTKNREPLLAQSIRSRLHAYLATVLNNLGNPAVKVGGTRDHVHILFRLSKNSTLAEVVEKIKTNSSKWVKTQARSLRGFYWQNDYGAFSVSPNEADAVSEHIEKQEEHHRAVSFQEEYREFLKAHGMEYDERYVWD